MKFVSDFKKFISRGNVVDLAVGFTVGAAFTAFVKSLVTDIIMPPLSLMLGEADFTNKFILLQQPASGDKLFSTLADAQASGAVTVNYGVFINNLIALAMVGVVMYFVIRGITKMDDGLEREFGRVKAPGEPTEKKCPFCLSIVPFQAIRCGHCTSQLDNKRL